MALKIVHDLSKLDAVQLTQYLRDVSEYIGLDPDMGPLDTIWMQNENGAGQSLVVYARRGTAEILRQRHEVSTESLTHEELAGSIVFTAKGRNGKGRTEVATGAKYIELLAGKARDNAIMTASTRALRRLTMQFTGLGILDESEVHAVEPNLANPAAAVNLAPVAPLPTVQPSSAPGKVVELPPAFAVPAAPVAPAETITRNFATHQAEFITEAHAQLDAKAAVPSPAAPVAPVETATSSVSESAPKAARKPRKARNTVTLGDVEPETVQDSAGKIAPVVTQVAVVATPAPQPDATLAPAPVAVPAQVNLAVPPQVNPADFAGKPNDVQMADYRKKVSVFTAELPSSENMGSVQKMRVFITHMSGTSPQFMTVEQWEEQLAWFNSFVERNKMKGLITYINDALGVK